MDASTFDWRHFDELNLLSAKINQYVNIDNPMVLPHNLGHLSFSGITFDPLDLASVRFFSRVYQHIKNESTANT